MGAPYPILPNGHATSQGIWDETQTAVVDVGTRAWLPDGRVFYYARNSSTALVAGNLLSAPAEDAQDADLAVNTAAAGDTTVTITPGSTAQVANAFAGGYLCVVDDTGEGITYKIASHPAIVASTAFVMTLVDPINVGFAAATTVTMVKNPWADVVIAPTNQAHFSVGIPQMAVTAGTAAAPYYFWCQTWGISCAWQDDTTASGAGITSGSTAGQTEINGGTDQQIGVQWVVGIAGENQPVFLTIAP
jgi:hypothetical protein